MQRVSAHSILAFPRHIFKVDDILRRCYRAQTLAHDAARAYRRFHALFSGAIMLICRHTSRMPQARLMEYAPEDISMA